MKVKQNEKDGCGFTEEETLGDPAFLSVAGIC